MAFDLNSKAPTIRETQRELKDMGAQWLRQKGSHESWKLPNGETVTISIGASKQASLSLFVWASLKKALRK